MKTALLTLAAVLAAPAAHAVDLNALGRQFMANPAVQQQAAQTVAANPQLATAAMQQAFANLTPQQTSQIAAQIDAITRQLFTQKEQDALTQFQSSPEGASIIAKLPQLAQQLAPVLLQIYTGQTAGVTPAAGK